MDILRAETAGFCMGVDLALRKLDAVLAEHERRTPLFTFGPIIHNPQVLADYARAGVRQGDDPEAIPANATVVIRAHGLPRGTVARLKARQARLVDATCPKVKKAQMLIARQAQRGRFLLLFGEERHPEVKGLLSHASRGARVFDSIERLADMELPSAKEYFLAAQTTQDQNEFEAIKAWLGARFGREIPVLDTICDATMKRQQEALDIAGEVEYMIVVGGRDSGNTRRLVQVAQTMGTPCAHVEIADELPLRELAGKRKIGLTAGASTPKSIIDHVHSVLASL